MRWGKLAEKLSFAAGDQDDLQRPFLALGNGWAVDLHRVVVRGCVLHLERTIAAQLDAVMEDRASVQLVGSEAGAGVVDFEQLNWLSGAIFDGGVHVVGVAAGSGQQERS